jgi:hypothetical protein
MKFECKQIFYSFYSNSEYKEKQIQDLVYADGKPVTPRNSMQLYGQMIKSIFGQNIWVDTLVKQLENIQDTNIIVTDCRFKYELDELKKRLQDKYDVITIRIKRDTGLIDEDISETDLDSLDDSYFDYILENNGTKKEFEQKIKTLKTKILNRIV